MAESFCWTGRVGALCKASRPQSIPGGPAEASTVATSQPSFSLCLPPPHFLPGGVPDSSPTSTSCRLIPFSRSVPQGSTPHPQGLYPECDILLLQGGSCIHRLRLPSVIFGPRTGGLGASSQMIICSRGKYVVPANSLLKVPPVSAITLASPASVRDLRNLALSLQLW